MMLLRLGEEEEAGVSPERTKRVKDLCESWVANGSTPALIVLVARHGIIYLHQAWGKLRPEPNSPSVAPDSIFGVASVSKPVTATAVMILVERGQIGINQPVQRYIPEFKGDGYERVTVRHLLTHTSGLPDNSDTPFSDLGRTGLRLSPGQEMRYSNVGFDLLGEIVERLSKRPFHEFTRGNIFEPLGMKDATFIHPGKSGERFIQPRPGTTYDWSDEFQGKTSSSSTLCATAMDMAIFGQTFLNNGSYGNYHLLSPATVAAMTQNQIPGIPGETHNGVAAPPCGFGWFKLEQCRFPQWPSLLSPQSYGHSGASGAVLWVDPKFDIVGVFFFVKISEDFWPKDLFVDAIMGSITDK
jgi:CubicO group peptidase (beta-lactamase class C family)